MEGEQKNGDAIYGENKFHDFDNYGLAAWESSPSLWQYLMCDTFIAKFS